MKLVLCHECVKKMAEGYSVKKVSDVVSSERCGFCQRKLLGLLSTYEAVSKKGSQK